MLLNEQALKFNYVDSCMEIRAEVKISGVETWCVQSREYTPGFHSWERLLLLVSKLLLLLRVAPSLLSPQYSHRGNLILLSFIPCLPPVASDRFSLIYCLSSEHIGPSKPLPSAPSHSWPVPTLCTPTCFTNEHSMV